MNTLRSTGLSLDTMYSHTNTMDTVALSLIGTGQQASLSVGSVSVAGVAFVAQR